MGLNQRGNANGGDSGAGGGMGIIDPNNKIHLADLISKENPLIKLMYKENEAGYRDRINNVFFRDKSKIWPLGTSSLLGLKFSQSMYLMLKYTKEFRIFELLVDKQCLNAPIFFFRPRLVIKDKLSKNIWSPRFSPSIQEPLAYFHLDRVIYSESLISKLPAEDYLALGIHECLRYLNSDRLQIGLLTIEIEALTRYLVGVHFPDDFKLIQSAKMKMLNISRELSNFNSWIAGAKLNIKLEDNFAKFIKQLSQLNEEERNIFMESHEQQRRLIRDYFLQSMVAEINDITPKHKANILFTHMQLGLFPTNPIDIRITNKPLNQLNSIALNNSFFSKIELTDILDAYEQSGSLIEFYNLLLNRKD